MNGDVPTKSKQGVFNFLEQKGTYKYIETNSTLNWRYTPIINALSANVDFIGPDEKLAKGKKRASSIIVACQGVIDRPFERFAKRQSRDKETGKKMRLKVAAFAAMSFSHKYAPYAILLEL